MEESSIFESSFFTSATFLQSDNRFLQPEPRKKLEAKSKRKLTEEDSVFEEIKKFRISNTCTAGELRMRKDVARFIEYLGGVADVCLSIEETSERRWLLTFNDPEPSMLNPELPSHFLISVPKFYPHSAPTVFCLQMGFIGGPFFDFDGKVLHPIFTGRDWVPTMSLENILATLKDVRSHFFSSFSSFSSLPNERETVPIEDEDL